MAARQSDQLIVEAGWFRAAIGSGVVPVGGATPAEGTSSLQGVGPRSGTFHAKSCVGAPM